MFEHRGNRILDAVTFSMHLDEHVAVIGPSGSGKNELALLLARLMRPTSGRIMIAGHELGEMPLAVVGRRIGYVAAAPYLFTGTLRDNLLLARFRDRLACAWTFDDESALEPTGMRLAGRSLADPDDLLVFLSPNPDAPDRYLLVITALRSRCLAEVRRIPTAFLPDFLALRGGRPSHWGYFGADWR